MIKLLSLGIVLITMIIALHWFEISIALTILLSVIFSFVSEVQRPFLCIGSILMAVALIFYFTTLRLMLPGIKNNRLITTGAYRFCRNPLYSALLLFLVPGLSLVLNSWLILTTAIVGYLIFRKFIHEEEELLERIFGGEYLKYKKKTNRLFPNPFGK